MFGHIMSEMIWFLRHCEQSTTTVTKRYPISSLECHHGYPGPYTAPQPPKTFSVRRIYAARPWHDKDPVVQIQLNKGRVPVSHQALPFPSRTFGVTLGNEGPQPAWPSSAPAAASGAYGGPASPALPTLSWVYTLYTRSTNSHRGKWRNPITKHFVYRKCAHCSTSSLSGNEEASLAENHYCVVLTKCPVCWFDPCMIP